MKAVDALQEPAAWTIAKILGLKEKRTKDRIDHAEAAILELPQRNAPVFHHFGGGFYMREIVIPADSLLTSKTHLFEHPFFILKGDISVFWHDEDTPEMAHRYTGPTFGVTKAGTRRVLYAHTETNWITVHRTDKNDPDDIIDEITAPHENPHIHRRFKLACLSR